MFNSPARLIVAILAFVIGISVVAGWFYCQEPQKVIVELPNSKWEQIFFKLINKATELGGLEKLRESNLNKDDVEVRVWRGFGLGDLEGVVLKRTNSEWKAFHVKADDYWQPQRVEVIKLVPLKTDWDTLWKNVTERGLLKLRDPSEKNCEDSGLDGTSYVVEVSQNNFYRTYWMLEGGKCEGVSQIEAIADLIGEEFDSGQTHCKTTEWFPCSKSRKSYRQNGDS